MEQRFADELICVITALCSAASESINVPNNVIRRFFYPIKRLFTFRTYYRTKNVFIVNNIYDIIDKVSAGVPGCRYAPTCVLRFKNDGRSVKLGKERNAV